MMPNVGHTYLWKKRGLEWDGMVIQYLSERVGVGVIGSNLTQITNDRGPIADLLHGFEGRAWGVA